MEGDLRGRLVVPVRRARACGGIMHACVSLAAITLSHLCLLNRHDALVTSSPHKKHAGMRQKPPSERLGVIVAQSQGSDHQSMMYYVLPACHCLLAAAIARRARGTVFSGLRRDGMAGPCVRALCTPPSSSAYARAQWHCR